ncbi:MAG: AAA family ATPase [Rikenellaceae bacterium]
MKSYTLQYISKINLHGFCGDTTLSWDVESGVNVLSGGNGSGKSTLIHALSMLFCPNREYKYITKPFKGVAVECIDGTKIGYDEISFDNKFNRVEYSNIDVITTFDTPLKISEAVQQLSNKRVVTELDWELYKVLDRYMKYQLSVGKLAIELLMSGKDKSEVEALIDGKNRFFDIIDSLFIDSGKSVERESDELTFNVKNRVINPYQLSSGEKQLIIILTTVLTQNCRPSILIMDEPEISLHHVWQRDLLKNVMELNPKLQLITTTHSPALIMDGWMDRVTDISEISSD